MTVQISEPGTGSPRLLGAIRAKATASAPAGSGTAKATCLAWASRRAKALADSGRRSRPLFARSVVSIQQAVDECPQCRMRIAPVGIVEEEARERHRAACPPR